MMCFFLFRIVGLFLLGVCLFLLLLVKEFVEGFSCQVVLLLQGEGFWYCLSILMSVQLLVVYVDLCDLWVFDVEGEVLFYVLVVGSECQVSMLYEVEVWLFLL